MGSSKRRRAEVMAAADGSGFAVKRLGVMIIAIVVIIFLSACAYREVL